MDMAIATTSQAVEIIKMQAFGAPVTHIKAMLDDNGIDTVLAYHVTETCNVDGIKSVGIKATGCYNRQDAIYVFIDSDDAQENAENIVGTCKDCTILTVSIPAEIAATMKDDGLYNGTFANSYSASRIEIDTVPATWIK